VRVLPVLALAAVCTSLASAPSAPRPVTPVGVNAWAGEQIQPSWAR